MHWMNRTMPLPSGRLQCIYLHVSTGLKDLCKSARVMLYPARVTLYPAHTCHVIIQSCACIAMLIVWDRSPVHMQLRVMQCTHVAQGGDVEWKALRSSLQPARVSMNPSSVAHVLSHIRKGSSAISIVVYIRQRGC
jgi:hypothetical protein